MWKIWLAIGVGGTVGVITIFTGIMNQARLAVILYRAIISIVLMGGISFALALLGEKFLLPYLLHTGPSLNNETAKEAEAKNSEEQAAGEEEVTEEKEQAEFSPFTAENLNRVSPPNS